MNTAIVIREDGTTETVYRYADRAGITLKADPGDGSKLMTFEVVE